ncbi:MAG TPA: hypothetical protein EYP23_00570 [Thermoplasmata archaeon]|nr:hypothetical protein [Thermoplasmata archaeon]
MIRKIGAVFILGMFLLSTGLFIANGKDFSQTSEGSFGPRLSYYPTSYDFGDKQEGENDSTTFEIWNSGCCALSYLLIENCSWITVDPVSGYSIGERDRITVNISTAGLAPGLHTYRILISSNGGDGFFTVTVNVTDISNHPPNPPVVDGPASGCIGEEYIYMGSSTDPDGDQLYYNFSWGDGTYSGWLGLYNSGSIVSVKHVWTASGTFEVKVKAKDVHGAESQWSDSLLVGIEIITKPEPGVYVANYKVLPLPSMTIVFGSIDVEVNASGMEGVDFYIDGVFKATDTMEPYVWTWDEKTFGKHTIKVVAYDNAGNHASDEVTVWKFL